MFEVIIDKPFARTTDEADRAIKLAKEKRLLLTCFQNRRYVSRLRIMKLAQQLIEVSYLRTATF